MLTTKKNPVISSYKLPGVGQFENFTFSTELIHDVLQVFYEE